MMISPVAKAVCVTNSPRPAPGILDAPTRTPSPHGALDATVFEVAAATRIAAYFATTRASELDGAEVR